MVYKKRIRERRKNKKQNENVNKNKIETGTIKIYNLSNHCLTSAENEVLKKGLKYAPSSNYDSFNTFVDLKKFVRKITLKKFFATQVFEEKERKEVVENKWKIKSTFFPTHSKGCFIETFEKIMIEEIKKLDNKGKKKKKYINTNMTKKERQALKDLKDNNKIIIKPADKGGR